MSCECKMLSLLDDPVVSASPLCPRVIFFPSLFFPRSTLNFQPSTPPSAASLPVSIYLFLSDVTPHAVSDLLSAFRLSVPRGSTRLIPVLLCLLTFQPLNLPTCKRLFPKSFACHSYRRPATY